MAYPLLGLIMLEVVDFTLFYSLLFYLVYVLQSLGSKAITALKELALAISAYNGKSSAESNPIKPQGPAVPTIARMESKAAPSLLDNPPSIKSVKSAGGFGTKVDK